MTRNERIRLLRLYRERERRAVADPAGGFSHFLARYAQIEDKRTGTAIPFALWPAQKRILPDILGARQLIILKARQLGLTWLVAAYCLWACITRPYQLIVVISAKEDWAVEFLDRVRFLHNRLPDWIRRPLHKDGAQHMSLVHEWETDRRRPMVVSEIKSLATTLEGAQGKTPTLLVMDETARNRYARQIFASSWPGIEKAGGRVIVISNSHKDGPGWGWTRGIFSGAMQGTNGWDRIFMPWWDCPERLTEDEARQMADDTGARPVEFRSAQIRAGMDEDDFSQNYPETETEAISALLGSYFGRSLARHDQTAAGIVGAMRDGRDGLEWVEDSRGYLAVWRYPYHELEGWDERPWTNRYVIGSDVSEGLGQSYSVAYVYDRLLEEFVARARSNRVDAYLWAEILWRLSRWYWSGIPTGDDPAGWYARRPALICAETTGAGQTTVRRLAELGANLYQQLAAPRAGSEVQARFGWHESHQAKHDLSEDLRHWLKHTRGTVYDATLIEECGTWVRHDDGKLGPEDDTKYGDCVIAAGLAVQADLFVGASPQRINPPLTGWRRELAQGKESPWVH